MSGFSDPILTGSGSLIRVVEKSSNYVTGVSGWAIFSDGSAEFNAGTFRGTVVISSAAQSLLVYSGTPALGNLLLSIAPGAGHDSFGNYFPQGLGAFGSNNGAISSVGANDGTQATRFIQMLGTNLAQTLFFQPDLTTFIDGYIKVLASTGSMAVVAPQRIVGGAAPSITLTPETASSAGDALIAIVTNLLTTSAPLTRAGQSWQTPAYGSGWADGPNAGTFQPLRYRVDAEDNLRLFGACHTTSATPAATIFTLSAGWRPAVSARGFYVGQNNAGTPTVMYGEVNSSGAVSVTTALAASGKDLYWDAQIPMGNIT